MSNELFKIYNKLSHIKLEIDSLKSLIQQQIENTTLSLMDQLVYILLENNDFIEESIFLNVLMSDEYKKWEIKIVDYSIDKIIIDSIFYNLFQNPHDSCNKYGLYFLSESDEKDYSKRIRIIPDFENESIIGDLWIAEEKGEYNQNLLGTIQTIFKWQ